MDPRAQVSPSAKALDISDPFEVNSSLSKRNDPKDSPPHHQMPLGNFVRKRAKYVHDGKKNRSEAEKQCSHYLVRHASVTLIQQNDIHMQVSSKIISSQFLY